MSGKYNTGGSPSVNGGRECAVAGRQWRGATRGRAGATDRLQRIAAGRVVNGKAEVGALRSVPIARALRAGHEPPGEGSIKATAGIVGSGNVGTDLLCNA